MSKSLPNTAKLCKTASTCKLRRLLAALAGTKSINARRMVYNELVRRRAGIRAAA